MTPLQHFDAVWTRCSTLAQLHIYMSSHGTSALKPDEMLRAVWVARVAALDLFVHELVAQRMVMIFEGRCARTPAFEAFRVPAGTVMRIRAAGSETEASAAFDLEVRRQLSFVAFQMPDKIADGIRLISTVKLWNGVARKFGARGRDILSTSKRIRKDLSIFVDRRNKIAHEGDLQPSAIREPWPICKADERRVEELVVRIVEAIDAIV